MNPTDLIPSPDAIPIHHGVFQILLLFTFFLHLIIMNVMLGSSIIASWYGIRREKTFFPIEKILGEKLPIAVAFTINSGIAPLLFIQVLYGQFIYTSSILSAWQWLSVPIFLLIAYYMIYLYSSFTITHNKNYRMIVIGIATALFLIIAFIFTKNMTLMLHPEKWAAYFKAADGTFIYSKEPSFFPRYLHFIIASVAMGGLFLSFRHTISKRIDGEEKVFFISTGLKWFKKATILQFAVGLLFFLTLENKIQSLFLGKDIASTILLLSAVACAFISYYLAVKERIIATLAVTILTIFLMVLVRNIVREATLYPYFKITELKVEPEYIPFYIFLSILIIGIGLIIYMLRLSVTQKKEFNS